MKHVPANVRSVLSVGCGAGVTEEKLIERGVDVIGIEMNHAAASAARQRGLTVFEGDVTSLDDPLDGRTFDCLIYADVLEHLVDPERVLRQHVARLRPGGTAIISVPNFRHYSVLWQLAVRGLIRYADAGILDHTHVRMTTRRMVEQWMSNAYLVPQACDYRMSQRRWKVVSALSGGLFREFIAGQVIVVGTRCPATA